MENNFKLIDVSTISRNSSSLLKKKRMYLFLFLVYFFMLKYIIMIWNKKKYGYLHINFEEKFTGLFLKNLLIFIVHIKIGFVLAL